MKGLKYILVLSAFLVSVHMSFAGAASVNTDRDTVSVDSVAGESETGKINVPKLIFNHIGNSYEWHITKIGKKDIAMNLPVIARSSTGWHVFSSKRFEKGPYEGLYISSGGKYEGKIVEKNAAGEEVRPFDISITKNVLSLFMSSVLLVVLILICARWYKRHDVTKEAPTGLAALMEPVIMMIHSDVVKGSIGEDYERYSPYLCTAFFWILINNLLGIIPFFPGGANLTGNITITFFLAVCSFIAINLFGNKNYFKSIFWPEVPLWLKVPIPLMPVIEIFSAFTKPFALMVRLFANMMAGHILLLSLICVIFIFAKYGAAMVGAMSFVTVLFGIFMDLLELLVAVIQAYVFTILSAIFIGLSRQK
ncbi:MAG: F0F1 ATP synthase subunit A [Bacteroidales bacterium]|jgi:F-type H+-transporting ATPase subunit a|nr:F0F1 ATP synthase subunit A [Bacteroidales bacterium]